MKSKEYVETTKKMFSKWKNKPAENGVNHKDSVFVSDGIVNPDIWYKNNVRLLFLLKEAYGGTEDWDLAKDLLKTNKSLGPTWKRVSQWTYGILNTSIKSIPGFKKSSEFSKGNNEWLNKIAVMNCKKSNGKSTSTSDDIKNYTCTDQKELLEQLKVIDPTVIVCGYTYENLEIIIGQKLKKIYGNNENWFYSFMINNHTVIVLDYYHPANDYPDLLNFYGLVGIYQQALKSKDDSRDM